MEHGGTSSATNRPALGRVAWFAGVAGCVMFAGTFAMSLLWTYGHDGPVTNPTDFRAFYCAGEALAGGEDPYRMGPLRRCQRSVLAANGLLANDRHLLPVPLPPYAIATFALLSRLPFRLATELWLASSMLATGFIVVVVCRLSGIRPGFVALSFVASVGFASLIVAQLVPFALAGLVYAAWCARRNDGVGAAIGATMGAIEPHVALPVWLALAFFVPVARAPLSVAAAVLASVSLSYGRLSVEYFASVLPAHARSELFSPGAQYSLSALLAGFGVPASVALHAGAASYAIAVVAGIVIGVRLQRAYADPAFCIVAPLAAVVLGGPHIHIYQMAAALPLALMLSMRQRCRSFSRAAVLLATIGLAVPWQSIAELPFFADRAARRIAVVAPAIPLASETVSVEIPYTAYVDAFARRLDRRTFAQQLALKAPTWTALIVLLAIAARARKSGAGVSV